MRGARPDLGGSPERQKGAECFSTQALDSPSGASFGWQSRKNLFGHGTVGPSSPPLSERGDLISTRRPEEDQTLQHQPGLDAVPEETVGPWGIAPSVPPSVANEETGDSSLPLPDASPVLRGSSSVDRAKEPASTDIEDSVVDESTDALVAAGSTAQTGEATVKENSASAVVEHSNTIETSEISLVPSNGQGAGAVVTATHTTHADDTELGQASENSVPRNPRADGVRVVEAVVEAAHELATHSAIPGVSEAAGLVSILVRLVTDHRGGTSEVEWRVKRCRSIVFMLNRAGRVLGKVRRSFERAGARRKLQ